jgi:hypothetical protein
VTVTDADLAALDPDAVDRSFWALLARRIGGSFTVDEWGRDEDLIVALERLLWFVPPAAVEGAEFVPEVGPALVVHERRPEPATPLSVAVALGHATGRPVRFGGVPDLAPVGPLLRRLGGVATQPDDLRSLLRAGEIVVVSLGLDLRRPTSVGRPDATVLGVALEVGAPVVPVAVRGAPALPTHRLVVGRAVPTRHRRAVLDAAELCATTRDRVAALRTASRL